jgi:tetratricopeptide (TPR) repeat protein
VKTVLSWLGALVFGCAGLAAVRLAAADAIARQDTPNAIARAIRLDWPAPSAELEQTAAELDPAHAREHLDRAVEINPRSSAAWIALGLLEDASKDSEGAGRSLNRAAQADHQYLPAWTLTNFYFRQANHEKFWIWADRAATLTYDDFQPLLDLCDRFEPNPIKMLAHFRDARKLRAPYLDFLIARNRLDAAQQVTRGMSGEIANEPRLINLADRQLRAGNATNALELWNAASGFPPLEPSVGRVLTNGDLARAPSNLGFDWRLGHAEGIAERWTPSKLIFTLSGSQPEACVLLEQSILLAPHQFRLRFEYVIAATGVHWSLDRTEGPTIERSSQWTEGTFDLPRAEGLRNLRLFYRREPGTVRSEGRIQIRNLRLEGS